MQGMMQGSAKTADRELGHKGRGYQAGGARGVDRLTSSICEHLNHRPPADFEASVAPAGSFEVQSEVHTIRDDGLCTSRNSMGLFTGQLSLLR